MNCSEDSASVGISYVKSSSNEAVHGVVPLSITPLGDSSSVIDIADDGTWETKPFEAVNKSEAVGEDAVTTIENNSQPDFLATRDKGNMETVKIKHVTQAHSSHYYVNCVQPVVQEPLSNGGEVKTSRENFTDGEHSVPIESSRLSVENFPECRTEDGNGECLEAKGELLNEECCAVSEEVTKTALRTPGAVEEKDLAEDALQDSNEDVVVTDSILQNKEKTKTYWEEIMMAAVASSPTGKEQKLHTPEAKEDLSTTFPKIVETMAKRMDKEESVTEQESRGQEELEEPLETKAEERRWDSCVETPHGMAELKIALELREMREREEELRKVRRQLGLMDDGGKEESTLPSIPTTDEGNFSECGGEDKDGRSQLSLDLPSLESSLQNGYVRQRTQSMDSTSSGHSSTSGGQHVGVEYPPLRSIAKPLTYPEEEQHSRSIKETPIEREIRTAREREEELRREKGRIQTIIQTPPGRPEVSVHNTTAAVIPSVKGSQNVQLRLATDRIQREIQETTEREKELREAGKIQTMSEDTVDSKVTRIGEIADHNGAATNSGTKIQKSLLAFQKNMSSPPPIGTELEKTSISNETQSAKPVTSPSVPNYTLNHSISASSGLGIVGSTNSAGTPKRFMPTAGQRGLMERFLASRGKMTCISPFSSSSSSSSSSLSPSSPAAVPLSSNQHTSIRKSVNSTHSVSPATKYSSNAISDVQKNMDIFSADNQQTPNEPETETPHRRGWMSAEEKIQEELKEMKIREDELRLQRAHIMAQSQPNLLSIMDEEDNTSQSNEDEGKLTSLYYTLSNPSLLDLDGDSSVRELDSTQEQIVKKNSRRKSALIVHWENRIQQSN